MASNDLSNNEEYIRRFSFYRILEHFVLIALFVVMATTGLVQKFHSQSFSQSIIMFLGGIDDVRYLHHIAGAFFILLIFQHIIAAFAGLIFRNWEPSMFISLKDVRDALDTVRYYMGLAESPPMYGRYTYKEKFVYWLILLGGIQMISTGLVLWFPVTVTKYATGQIIPVSKIIHSNEAMLIFLIIVVWHIYDSVLNPEVFPINKSIFTGYIKKSRMKREHPLEFVEYIKTRKGEVHGYGSDDKISTRQSVPDNPDLNRDSMQHKNE